MWGNKKNPFKTFVRTPGTCCYIYQKGCFKALLLKKIKVFVLQTNKHESIFKTLFLPLRRFMNNKHNLKKKKSKIIYPFFRTKLPKIGIYLRNFIFGLESGSLILEMVESGFKCRSVTLTISICFSFCEG